MSNKYNAKKVKDDGYTFDSKMEHRRYQELKLLVAAGEIKDLVVHQKYPLVVNGMKVGTYTADFNYLEDGKQVVEDVKGARTLLYRLKRNLMKAIYNIDILETGA